MNCKNITWLHIGVWLSRIFSLSLSAMFAYKFAEDSGYTAIALALAFIVITEIARIESFKKLMLGLATRTDGVIFLFTLLVSVLTVTGTISSKSSSKDVVLKAHEHEIKTVESRIDSLKSDIKQFNTEIQFYTNLGKVRNEVNWRRKEKNKLDVELIKQEDLLNSLLIKSVDVKSSSSATEVITSVLSILKVNANTEKVRTIVDVVTALSIDILGLVFIGWIIRKESLNNDQSNSLIDETNNSTKTEKLYNYNSTPLHYGFQNFSLNLTGGKDYVSKASDVFVSEVSSSSEVGVKSNPNSIKKASDDLVNSTDCPNDINELLKKATELVFDGTVKKGFRSNLRKHLGVADATAKAIADMLVENGTLDSYKTPGGLTMYKLPSSTKQNRLMLVAN